MCTPYVTSGDSLTFLPRCHVADGDCSGLPLWATCRSASASFKQVQPSLRIAPKPLFRSIPQHPLATDSNVIEVATRAVMVYEWDEHQQTCHRLYVEEGKSLTEIRDHMKTVYKFTPR